MKGSRLYLLFLFAFLVIVFVVELNAPHKFVWKPTFDKHDKEPFGSYVFDDVLSSSIENYTVSNLTFYQTMLQDSVTGGRAFLVTEQNPDFGKIDIEYLYKLLHLGNRVMICADYFSHYLQDTLCFDVIYDNYHYWFNVNNMTVRDSIFFGTDTLKPVQIFEVFPQIHTTYLITNYETTPSRAQNQTCLSYAEARRSSFPEGEKLRITNQDGEDNGDGEEDDGDVNYERVLRTINCDSVETLVWDSNNKALVIRAFIGKGELFLVTTPLMFTNFGMLDGSNASYVFRLLSYMKGRPLTRIEVYGDHDNNPQTPLRYILAEPALRHATYFGMALLLLFMAFTAKRRQRIIPVVQAPQNRSLGFMLLISNLYYQKHDNIEMLKMKYRFFCADVKNHTGIELYEQLPGEHDYERLIEKTGLEKDFIISLLHNIRVAIYSEEADDKQLKHYIDGMNEILQALI